MVLTEIGLAKVFQRVKSFVIAQLNSKASVLHTHTYSEIVDLPNGIAVDSTLDGTSSNAISNSAVSNALDGKSNTGHTHSKSEITDFPSLATVATSGSYTDLSNKPTIPTVNNATLTIQKNGSNVATFTANASSNVTANITVPTKTSQLTNDSGYITGIAWGSVTGKPSTFTPSSHTHDDRYYTESEINTLLLSKVYPVGAIYISVNSVNPGTLFGGTWERIKDKFLLSSGDTYSIGSTGGNSSTTLKIANLPSHNHTGTTGNESQGHTHSGTTGNQSANHTHTFSGTTSSSGSHTHKSWTDSQGSHSHNSGHGWHNVEPGSDRQCLSDHYLGSDEWSGNKTSSAGSHSHNVGMDSNGSHTHTYSGTTSGASANHTHNFTTGGISAHHTHSFTTSSVGSTEAFSNMPPYLTVNIWKRTA